MLLPNSVNLLPKVVSQRDGSWLSITELLGLEGSSGGRLVQPPARAGGPRAFAQDDIQTARSIMNTLLIKTICRSWTQSHLFQYTWKVFSLLSLQASKDRSGKFFQDWNSDSDSCLSYEFMKHWASCTHNYSFLPAHSPSVTGILDIDSCTTQKSVAVQA